MNKIRSIFGVSAVCAAALFGAHSANATVVFSDTLDYGSSTALDASDSVFGGNWTTTSGTVDYLAPPPAQYSELCRGTAGCVDLDGSSGNAGVFSTTQSFAAGTYLLTLGLFGNSRGGADDLVITLGDAVLTFMGIGAGDDKSGVYKLTTSTDGVLSFSNAGGDNVGAILTSVQVSSVPLPAALPLLAAGLGVLGVTGLCRKRTTIA